jgi:hypothetical protein
VTEDKPMIERTSRLYYLALIPLVAVVVLSELHRDGLFQRLSLLLLTTTAI